MTQDRLLSFDQLERDLGINFLTTSPSRGLRHPA